MWLGLPKMTFKKLVIFGVDLRAFKIQLFGGVVNGLLTVSLSVELGSSNNV